MRHWHWVARLFVVTLILQGAVYVYASYRDASSREQNRCYAVQVESIGSTSSSEGPRRARRRRSRPRFSARESLDLRFRVLLPPRNQSGLVEIKLYTPTGHVYDTLRAGEEPASEKSGGDAPSHAYHFRRARTVTADLPIAGSYITRRSLYGEWRAEVYLDGGDTQCTRPTSFTLEP